MRNDNDVKERLGSVRNALRVLTMLSAEESIRGIDVARELGLAPSSAHKLLASLTDEGFARQAPGSRRYCVGPELLRLSRDVSDQHSLARSARPHMERLSVELHETVNLHVLAGRDILCVEAVVEDHHDLHVKQMVGRRLMAHASASGKVLLSYLDEGQLSDLLGPEPYESSSSRTITRRSDLIDELESIRHEGYAAAIGEREEGINAVAVAIPNPSYARPIAALSVATPSSRMPLPRVPEVAAALRRTSSAISMDYFGQSSTRQQ